MSGIKGSAGGKATAIVLRKNALERYNLFPNTCLNCDKIIEVREGQKVAEVRHKKFCNQTCAAYYNNRKFPRSNGLAKPIGICERCGKEFKFNKDEKKKRFYNKRRFCSDCRYVGVFGHKNNYQYHDRISNMTKGELRKECSRYDVFRSHIAKHARKVYKQSGRPFVCEVCGYVSFVDVCHRRPVAKFSDDSKIIEIDSLSNLITLCPNHHTELDAGILNLNIAE